MRQSDTVSETAPPADLAGKAMWLAAIAMGVVGLVGYASWALNGGLVREGNWIGVDFHVYYQVAMAVRRGGDIYSNNISPPYVYPPLLAVLVVPLSLLPVAAATITWKLLQHLCLLVAGGLLVSLMPPRLRALSVGMLMLGLLTVPLQDEIQVGESNSVVLALIVGALWLIARKRQSDRALAVAGILLAFAVSIKVLPIMLVAFLWWRGPRTAAAVATGGFVTLQLLTLLLTPATAYYWLVQFPGLFGQAFPYPDNQSLNAFIARALLPSGPDSPPTQIVDAPTLRPIITWTANLLTLLASIGVLWASRLRHASQGAAAGTNCFLLEAGLVLLTIHLISGSTWLHHLIDIAIPMLALLSAVWSGRDTRDARRKVLLCVLAVIAFILLLKHPDDWLTMLGAAASSSPLLTLIAVSTPMWVVIGLWAGTSLALIRSPVKS